MHREELVAMVDFPTDSLASVGVCLLEWGRFWWLRDFVDTDGYTIGKALAGALVHLAR